MTTTDDQSQADNLLRWPEVQARIPISRSHAHALVAKGLFPRPIKIVGARASCWSERAINAFIAERVAASQQENPKTT